jgi:hypothetical protein
MVQDGIATVLWYFLFTDLKRCMNPTPVPGISALTVAAYVIAGGLLFFQWHDLVSGFMKIG